MLILKGSHNVRLVWLQSLALSGASLGVLALLLAQPASAQSAP